jgi:hypothetical protein
VAPFTVRFDRPLDAGLLAHCLRVVDPSGGPVAGLGRAGPNQRSWALVPGRPWAPGPHHLVVDPTLDDPTLEDLAGNSVGRVFDRDLDDPDQRPPDHPATRVRFDPL